MFVQSSSWDDEPARVIPKQDEILAHRRISVASAINNDLPRKRKRMKSVDHLTFEAVSLPKPEPVPEKENIAPPAQASKYPLASKIRAVSEYTSSSSSASVERAPLKPLLERNVPTKADVNVVTAGPTVANSPVAVQTKVSPVPNKRKRAIKSFLPNAKPDQAIAAPSSNMVFQDLKRKNGTKSTKGAEALRRRIKGARNDRWREANGIRRRGKRAVNFRREQLSKEMAHERNLMDAVTEGSLSEMFSPGVDRDVIQKFVDSKFYDDDNIELFSQETSIPIPSDEELLTFLQNEFGHTSFRNGQMEAIKSTLSGERSLIVLPTGTGKSLCYQFPSAYMRKKFRKTAITVVVSPLIALMADQLKLLPKTCRGAAIHSNLSPSQTSIVYSLIQRGHIDVVFMAPERLLMYSMRDVLSNVFLVAIDEAHCLSEWSHSFRPAYLSVAKIVDTEIKPHALLALTATATIQTVDSLRSCLSIPYVVRADGIGAGNSAESAGESTLVQRENLELFARRSPSPTVDFLEFLLTPDMRGVGPIIIYVQYKWQTENVSQVLRERGLGSAEGYHGGLSAVERKEIHDKFINNELRFVVATIAFGMGIDKRNVRSVIHLTLPKSIENYVQETGRCSRDGQQGFCRCYFNADDYSRIRSRSVVDAIRKDGVRTVVDLIFRRENLLLSALHDSESAGELIFMPEKIESIINKQHMTLVLSLIEGEQKLTCHHGFPCVVKLRFFASGIRDLAQIDSFVDILFKSPYKPKAGKETVSESGGVATVDILSAMSKMPHLTPPQFMHQLSLTAKAQKFAVAKSEWGHFLMVKSDIDVDADALVDSCFETAHLSHSLELNRLDASFALMSRIAAESIDDPRIGHKLIQQYFEAEARLRSGDDLVPSVLKGASPGILNSVMREINHIRGAN